MMIGESEQDISFCSAVIFAGGMFAFLLAVMLQSWGGYLRLQIQLNFGCTERGMAQHQYERYYNWDEYGKGEIARSCYNASNLHTCFLREMYLKLQIRAEIIQGGNTYTAFLLAMVEHVSVLRPSLGFKYRIHNLAVLQIPGTNCLGLAIFYPKRCFDISKWDVTDRFAEGRCNTHFHLLTRWYLPKAKVSHTSKRAE